MNVEPCDFEVLAVFRPSSMRRTEAIYLVEIPLKSGGVTIDVRRHHGDHDVTVAKGLRQVGDLRLVFFLPPCQEALQLLDRSIDDGEDRYGSRVENQIEQKIFARVLHTSRSSDSSSASALDLGPFANRASRSLNQSDSSTIISVKELRHEKITAKPGTFLINNILIRLLVPLFINGTRLKGTTLGILRLFQTYQVSRISCETSAFLVHRTHSAHKMKILRIFGISCRTRICNVYCRLLGTI